MRGLLVEWPLTAIFYCNDKAGIVQPWAHQWRNAGHPRKGAGLGKVTVHLAHLKGTDSLRAPVSGRPSNRGNCLSVLAWDLSNIFQHSPWRPEHCTLPFLHLQHVAFCPQDFRVEWDTYPAPNTTFPHKSTQKQEAKGPSFYTILLLQKIFLNGLPEEFPYISLAKKYFQNAINIRYPGRKENGIL